MALRPQAALGEQNVGRRASTGGWRCTGPGGGAQRAVVGEHNSAVIGSPSGLSWKKTQRKGVVTPTVTNVQGDALRFMDKTQDHRNSIEQLLAVGGGWRLAVGGGWWRLAVGGWRLVVLGDCPEGLSLTKTKLWFLRTALAPLWRPCPTPSYGVRPSHTCLGSFAHQQLQLSEEIPKVVIGTQVP